MNLLTRRIFFKDISYELIPDVAAKELLICELYEINDDIRKLIRRLWSTEFNEKHEKWMAVILNPYCKWPSDTVVDAYKNTIIMARNLLNNEYSSVNLNYDLPTPNPTDFNNPGICYWTAILLRNGVKLTLSQTAQSIFEAALVYLESNIYAYSICLQKLQSTDLKFMAATFMLNIDSGSNNNDIIKSIDVKTNSEACISAAKKWNCNLCNTDSPIIIYTKLIKNPNHAKNYPSLKTQYEPRLLEYYADKNINKYCEYEGIGHNIHEHIFNKPTFYYGWHSSANTTFAYKYNKTECKSGVISYGYWVNNKDNIVLSIEEWIGSFNTYKAIVHPVTQHSLPAYAIKKLINICNDYPVTCSKLLELINILSSNKDSLIKIINKYKINKLEIVNAIKRFTNIGMRMRGWKSGGYIHDIHKIGKKTNDILTMEIYDLLHNANDIESDILSLPLLLYHRGDYKHADIGEGETANSLYERFERILANDSEISCVATSSNWVLSTIANLANILEINIDYDVKKLKYEYLE